jgi:pectate lyase
VAGAAVLAGCSRGGGGGVPAPTTTQAGGEVTTTTEPGGGGVTTTTRGTPPPSGNRGVIGWASQNGGTTGGAGGRAVVVTGGEQLAAALKQAGPQVIRVQGMISVSGMVKVPANTTIVGVGARSGIAKGGLQIRAVKNVIVQNLVFTAAEDDSINVEESTNVWIDHNDLSNGYDGLVDIKRGSDFVTVSWNHVHDHHKTMLLGHSDDNGAQDKGHLRVTYHHNFFDGTETRHPRTRFGNPVHVYNNYYRGNSYGVASTMGSGVLVENNYFENVKEPTLVGYADSAPGTLVQRGNVFVGSGTPQAAGSVAPLPYRVTLDNADNVKATVSAGAGTGKVGG